eukprot:TRINITY_DN4750_c0_g1_i2.p1 TRINITY_DN4750_c0_g1~~TRINITY_DN4750_c0_g1_i2.p1  ORF type:complete len:484 (+),score=77.01 TRINITY_DN4750_c0_g1_i2:82-1452(+)
MSNLRKRQGESSKFSGQVETAMVKAVTVEQRWHWSGTANQGIWEIDYHQGTGKMVTAGDDGRAMIWEVVPQDGHIDFEYVSSLAKATIVNGCNTAKWSPTGSLIATGYDGGIVSIWRRTKHPTSTSHGDSRYNKEHWVNFKVLKLPIPSDVSVVEWSPDQRTLLAVTAGGPTLIWSITEGTVCKQALQDHQYRACGLAIDPFSTQLCTLGDDQRLCFYNRNNSQTTSQFVTLKVMTSDFAKGLVDQDKFRGLVRRPTWSPDGMFLLVPSAYQSVKKSILEQALKGVATIKKKRKKCHIDLEDDDDQQEEYTELHGCLVFLREKYDKASAFIPAPHGHTPICAAWGKKFYEYIKPCSATSEMFGALPYRMVYAIGSRCRATKVNSVFIYDTVHVNPLIVVNNVHQMPMTGLLFSNDDSTIISSSRDGYVSTIQLNSELLGQTIDAAEGHEVFASSFF